MMADVNLHAPCCGLEKSLSKWHGWSMAGGWHGHGMLCVNQTKSSCINQMGKTQSKPSATWHGRGTAWAWHGICQVTLMNAATLQHIKNHILKVSCNLCTSEVCVGRQLCMVMRHKTQYLCNEVNATARTHSLSHRVIL